MSRASRPLSLTVSAGDFSFRDEGADVAFGRVGVALLIVGGNELVDQAFGVNPAQRMRADAKLAGVVGKSHSKNSCKPSRKRRRAGIG
jgi:hypothetical protein